jgi:hypothetical protein
MTRHAIRHQGLRRSLVAAAIAAGLAFGSVGAQAANIVQGSIWLVTDAIAQNAIAANVPGSSPDVTFSVNSPLNFSIGESGAETVGAFLTSGGAFGIIENTGGALTTPGNNTLWLFEGLVSVFTRNPRRWLCSAPACWRSSGSAAAARSDGAARGAQAARAVPAACAAFASRRRACRMNSV